MTAKRYRSIAEMLADTAPDEEFRKEFASHVADRQVVKHLMALRAVRGVTQKEMAKRLNCSQARISKLESGTDDELRVGDLKRYLTALGFTGSLLVGQDLTLAEEIKFHAFRMKSLMDKLAHLAKGDEKLIEGVSGFLGECFFNLVNMIQDSANKLPAQPDGKPPLQIEIVGVDEAGGAAGVEVAKERRTQAKRRSRESAGAGV